ncbi:MAG TPA: hypothetical protein VGO29_05665 [Solirubrobacteraceae bacterium]|jgi:hypothetical protein|nr:hypothetical protein [Solirubrobacteraceae bacterium]
MTTPHLRLSGGAGAVHPVVLDRRIRDLAGVGLAGLVPAVIALGITVALPHTSLLVVLGAIVAVLAIVTLILNSRLELTVGLLAVYLGLLDGPIKLGIGRSEATAAVRNVLILAVCLGAVMRLFASRERVRLPPLSGWVLAFVAIVVVDAFNPKTQGLLHVLGGFRQQLQWVPFFFFGYVLLRSKKRLRQLFIIIGVIALANGVVSAYQTSLSPGQLAAWGPGYRALVQPTTVGKKGSIARTYSSEGVARVRPLGLGADSGFSGGVGVIALPCCLALLATWRSRRRWVAAVLCLGALVAVATGLGRLQVVGALLGVLAFAGLASLAGRKVTRALTAMLVVVALAVPLGALFVSAVGGGTFKRYESIAPGQAASTVPSHKSSAWMNIPNFLSKAPLGVGLGTVGAAGGFGGKVTELVEGHGVSAETQYNVVADELGAPGLLVWIALTIFVIVLVARGMREVGDGELAIMLAGLFAPFVALTLEGFSGPFITSTASGPYFWLAIGAAAYWFVGPGRQWLGARVARRYTYGQLDPAVPVAG